MRLLYAACVAFLVLGTVHGAHASPLIELTGGFGGLVGLQARHTGASASSAYFNPALLTRARTSVTAGLLILNTDIGVHIARRSHENFVPSGISDTFYPNGDSVPLKPLGTDQLQNGDASKFLIARPQQHQGSGQETLTYAAFGLVLNLFEERLGLGFYGLVPVKNFLRMSSFYVDEREQYMSNSLHPEMYGDRLTALSFAFAAGVRLTKTLSLGLGTTIGMYAYAGAPVFVASASQLTNLDLNIDVKSKVSLTPHLGLAWDLGKKKRWHLTGTVHAPQRLDLKSGITFVLAGGTSQSSSVSFTYFFQPWQISAGLGYDIYARGDDVWTVSGTAHYQRWSTYIDRQSVRPDGAYAWMDTLTGALGVRGARGPLSVGLDGQYKPSPVPDQTGRTNYVDNSRMGSSLSIEYAFEFMNVEFAAGLQLQLYRLLTRSVKKIAPPTSDGINHTPQLVWDEVPDNSLRGGQPVAGREGLQTNNPGWPGYKSMGWVSSGGLYLTVRL